MSIQEEHTATEDAKFFSTIFSSYMVKYQVFYTNSAVPNLGDVRGKIVLMVNNTSDLSKGIKYDSGLCDIENTYHLLDTDKKWPLVQKHLEKSLQATGKTLYMTFCSANGISENAGHVIAAGVRAVPNLEDFADRVLPLLATYLEMYPIGRYGMVIMDFPKDDIIRRIILSNDPKMAKEK